MPKNSKKLPPEPASKSRTLVNRLKPKQTPEQATAEMVVAGLASNAVTALEFSKFPFGDVELTEGLNALVDAAERVNRGDLGDAEALLMAQAVTLNAMFTHLAHRAQINMGEYLDAADRYMRLALKAQGQCRATLETLAVIKNPPTVFARQANIAHGPQQVNNGVSPRAGQLEIAPNELLEARREDRLDNGTTIETGTGYQEVAAVGALDRTAKR